MTRIMLLVSILLLAVAAQAGPPLICHPFEIGTAKSLPWGAGDGWNLPKNDYDRGRLIGDTLGLLNAETPVIVRMETLRRAAIYASKDPQIASDLLARLMSRSREAEGKGSALAFFDAGYLAETFKQMDYLFKAGNPGTAVDGYALVKKALSLRGSDGEMEFAAAIITQANRWGDHQAHLKKATATAAEGSLLARNLSSHFR